MADLVLHAGDRDPLGEVVNSDAVRAARHVFNGA
jgi:hypothetical protein